MNEEWKNLYDIAMSKINPHEVSANIYVGSVAAALVTKSGAIFTGVCIDASCSLGMCAERNALSTMLAVGENEVDKIIAVYKDGTVMSPCGSCRQFMMQLGETGKDIKVMVNNQGSIKTLAELMPEYPYE